MYSDTSKKVKDKSKVKSLRIMKDKISITNIKSEIEKGMRLPKCKKCDCMKKTLGNLLAYLPSIQMEESSDFIQNASAWLKEMESIKYTCLGCDYCFPAVAMNIFSESFPEAVGNELLSYNWAGKEEIWPPVPGEYFAFCEGPTCPVAISTLASVDLAENLAELKPEGLCIVGKTETENIGIDKVIKNTITNTAIRFLIITGKDPHGHHSGKTLLALSKNGIDRDMKIIGSPGRRPILKNVSSSEVEIFRRQIRAMDMIGCEDTKKIIAKVNELSKEAISIYECIRCYEPLSPAKISTIPKILASEPKKIKMDKAGYFVIIPSFPKKTIVVEHYAYDNKLLHIIEGKDASTIYCTIIENGWITELHHAAYLGKELARAELSLRYGFKYIQDKAPGKA